MNYFKNTNNKIYAYDDEQVAQGYGSDLASITVAEKEAIVNPPKTQAELNEIARQDAKTTRDNALEANTYTLADGSVYQVRPKDLPNFQTAIQLGVDTDWVLANNSVRLTTVAELQTILNAGVTQAKTIYDTYMVTLKKIGV